MILPKFEIYRPRTLTEALDWLAANRDKKVKVLAGGTDLLVDMRQPVIPSGHKPLLSRPPNGEWQARFAKPPRPEALCALWNLQELKGVRQDGESIRIGAITTITELERSPLVREQLTGLHDGAWQLGSALVRNRGTFGGNLCNARPAADTAIPTLALNGKLLLISVRGERIVAHDDFTLGPGKTIIEPDEILKEVIFDLNDWGGVVEIRSSYIKVAQRKSLEISVVGAAVAVGLDEDGKVSHARIALGAVAPKPLLVSEAAQLLVGRPLTTENISVAARAASEIASPITDHRGSRDYRKTMVEVLVRRALNRCCSQVALEKEPA
jgi:CO/xanthine dehydrogenase FAD-binding subunit